jgi:CBS domain-containing protein
MSITVRQLLREKDSHVWSVSPGASIFEALELMAQKDIGGVLVMEGEKLVGIFSERDYARKAYKQQLAAQDITVSEMMTQIVVHVKPEQTIDDCMAIMTSKHIRHLPVVEDERVIGMVTIRDVVNQVIAEQKFTIQQLEKYISGGQ